MKKEYKEFVIHQLYGLIDGTHISLESHMNHIFPEIFGFKPDKITVIESKHKVTDKLPSSWIGAMLATITIEGESFSYERDFGEEYEHDILHPDYETDDWFYEGDKCYAYFKCNEAIKSIEL
jgi:hypothetical protein